MFTLGTLPKINDSTSNVLQLLKSGDVAQTNDSTSAVLWLLKPGEDAFDLLFYLCCFAVAKIIF